MKRKDDASRSIRVRSLSELDAVVGKYLTGEIPRIHWTNSHTDFRFDSVEEAVEAVNDPFFSQFVHEDESPTTVLTEVREFRRYSSELTIAWELVEHLSHGLEPLLIRREGEVWEGTFGNRDFISAPTAPLVICLAALRTRGVEVDCHLQICEETAAAGVPGRKISSLYAR